MKQIIVGNSLEKLKELPAKSVNCVVTSPPYYGLRDYGMDEQIGLEETPQQFIDNLLEVFRECKRVLKDDGTLWVNIGDTYATGGGRSERKQSPNPGVGANNEFAQNSVPFVGTPEGCKGKDLIGIPWMLAFALRDDGWYLRQDIIWHKPNPMPESVKDRCVKSHEYIFLLSKKPHYYFDYEAIQEPLESSSIKRLSQDIKNQTGSYTPSKSNGKMKAVGNYSKYISTEQEASVRQGMSRDRGNNMIAVRKRLPTHEQFVALMRRNTSVQILNDQTDIPKTTIEHWFRTDESGFAFPSVEDWMLIRDYVDDWTEDFREVDQGMTEVTYETDAVGKNANGKRNKRDVWSVTTKGVKEAHFATFPEDLIEPCILAGCPKDGTVLDPFCGSGTTGIVSVRNERNFIGIELNPEYAEMSERRISREEGFGIQTDMFGNIFKKGETDEQRQDS